MKSMTSYGYCEYTCDKYIMTMELKSYNNRFLEVNYYSPSVLSPFEQIFTERVKQHAQRGHIDVSVKVKTLESGITVQIDENTLNAYIGAAETVDKCLKKSNLSYREPCLSDFLSLQGVVSSNDSVGLDFYKDGLEECTAEVLKQFDEAKDREGLATKNDLERMIDSIQASLDVVRANADRLESLIKDGLTARMEEMLGNQSYDENRILSEVAVMLMRFTINEETVRLDAHIAEFRRLLESSEPVGKRMDFLCQEMNREINTIGSKSQIVEINFEVVNMKDCLENIREQIRNIE